MIVNEVQSLRSSWMVYAILMIEIPTLILLTVLWLRGEMGENGHYVILFILLIMVMVMMLLLYIRLETKLDEKSFSYKCPPFLQTSKKLNKNEIKTISLRKMKGMFEFGGIGVRYKKSVKAYIFSDEYILEIELPDKKLVFSTKKPHDIHAILEEWDNYQSKIY